MRNLPDLAPEDRRKLVHILSGGFAFLLPFLSWGEALGLSLVALAFNAVLLPRVGGTSLLRPEERGRGWSPGILLYPASVAALILIFRHRLDLVAVMWGILAAGDGLAGLAGTRFGRHPLPWNPRKTFEGSAAYILGGALGAMLLLAWWNANYRAALHPELPSPQLLFPRAALLCFAIALFCAAIESWDTGVDDNLSVPILGAGLLACLDRMYPARLFAHLAGSLPESPRLLADLPGSRGLYIGLLVNVAAAAAAWMARTVSLSGALGGILVGLPIFAFLGWRGFLVLFAFFVLGSAMTKLRFDEKSVRGIAQESGGRRGARHALANCATGAILSFGVAGSFRPEIFLCGFVASFATAAFDTVSSEIGKAFGRTTILPTTFERVPAGTDGAVSLEGTVAGAVAGAAISILGALLGLLSPFGALAAFLGALAGTTLETYLGALRLDRGIDSDFLNFLNTIVGAASAIAILLLPT